MKAIWQSRFCCCCNVSDTPVSLVCDCVMYGLCVCHCSSAASLTGRLPYECIVHACVLVTQCHICLHGPTVSIQSKQYLPLFSQSSACTVPLHVLITPQARGRLMYKLADVMELHLTELALLESLDSGKPLSQTYLKEMPLCVDNFRYFAGYAQQVRQLVASQLAGVADIPVAVCMQPIELDLACVADWDGLSGGPPNEAHF